MAENLLSRDLMTTKEIDSFLAQRIDPLLNRGDNGYIKRLKANLESLMADSLRLEQEAYQKFGVKSLLALQIKIDTLNASGLYTMANHAIKDLKPIRDVKESILTKEQVAGVVEKKFLDFLNEQHDSVDEFVASATLEELNRAFQEFSGASGKKRRRKIVKKDNNNKIFLEFSSELKRDLAKEYGISPEIQIDKNSLAFVYDEGGEIQMNRYPYFGLTQQEKIMAKRRIGQWDNIWKEFKAYIKKPITNPRVKDKAETVLEKRMGAEAFVDAGGSFNDIVGIFGELQGLIMLEYLADGRAPSEFLGHEVNEKSQKIGIDLALDGIGFQVKNYSTNKFSGGETTYLGGTYTLKNFVEAINRSLEMPDQGEALQMFYAIYAYHTAKTKEFSLTRGIIEYIEKDELPRLYHGAVAELLPLKSLDLKGKRNMKNVFYLIGGTKILPVSEILKSFIKILEELEPTNDLLSRKILTTKTEYGGDTIKSLKGEFPGYNKIANQIKIDYRIRTSWNTSFAQVLEKGVKK